VVLTEDPYDGGAIGSGGSVDLDFWESFMEDEESYGFCFRKLSKNC